MRGEIFFARRWILVESVSDYLLLQALGQSLDWPLDVHGTAVIDFQQAGSPGIYAALAESFSIPWNILADGDAESTKFLRQLTDRGFRETDLRVTGQFATLPPPNNLEDQMLKVSANQMDYAAATSLYSRSLGLLKTAIGRR